MLQGLTQSTRTALLALLVALAFVCPTASVYGQSCDVIHQSWQGIPFDNSLNPRRHPPDPHGAAGPDGVLAAVNIRLSYYSKSGDLRWGPVCFRDFFPLAHGSGCIPLTGGGGISNYITDPRALYDPSSGRFYVIVAEQQMDSDDPDASYSYLHVAVSNGNDPATGDATSWTFKRLDITSVFDGCRVGDDYPGLAIDSQALYLTYQPGTFLEACGSPLAIAQHIISIDKASLLTSPVWTMTYALSGTLVPVSVLGTGSPGTVAYFAEFAPPASIKLWALSNPLLPGRVLTSAEVPIPAPGSIASAPQPSPCKPLDTRTGWPQGNAFWHAGALRFVLTGAANGRAQVNYFKIATNGFPNGTPTLVETKNLAGSDSWFQPAIGGNAQGDEGIVFSRSSTTGYPSIWFAWRRAGEAAFRGPVLVKASSSCYAGEASETILRWGDYATVTADPNDQTFWASHEWALGPGEKEYGTWWANLAAPPMPMPIGDLYAESPAGKTTMIVSWTEPPCSISYELRYSTSMITEANFGSAQAPTSQPVPTGLPGMSTCFTFVNLQPCRNYYFALKWSDSAGQSAISNIATRATKCSGLEVMCTEGGFGKHAQLDEGAGIGTPGLLESPRPTPSASSAEILYHVNAAGTGGDLEVVVFDIAGRRLRTLVQEVPAKGAHRVDWDLSTADGRRVEPGTYFVRLRLGTWQQTRTLLVVR